MNEHNTDPAPSLLPRPDHVAYLANLLTVLGILLGAYVVIRKQRAAKRAQVPYAPGWQAG